MTLLAQSAFPPGPATAEPKLQSGGVSFASTGPQFQGSVATGTATAEPLSISLQNAIDRGLKANLGLLARESSSQVGRAARIRALSALLPNVVGSVQENVQETNIAVFGFKFPGIPHVIGPFAYSDIRASASMALFDQTLRKNLQTSSQGVQALQLSVQDARDLVVEAVANAYLRIISDGARVTATRAQVATAQALYERARDQHAAGVSPAIDELRSQVELKTRQQELLALQNLLDKDKLSLARVIGLPSGQGFELSDSAPYAALEGLTPEQMLARAYGARADYQSAKVQLQMAETAREAANAQKYPALLLAGNWGANGINQAQLYRTFAFTGSVKVNLFDGGRIRADVMEADAVIKRRRDDLADLQGQIDQQVRSALLDLKSAADQVAVAQSNLDLANQTLAQARDRFTAGVTDNIEVVQAQDSVANAQQNLISSLYQHNLAKVELARAVGLTEASLKEFMGGK